MIGIYDENDVLITNLVDTALSYPDIIEVKSRTLEGKWHIQTIGTGATVLSVKAHLTLSEKNTMDIIKRNTHLVKVIFDGKYYIGIIDGKIDTERRKFADYPIFSVSFELLVQEEGNI